MSNEKLPDGWVRYSWGWRRNYGAGRKAPNSSVVEVEGLFLCEYWPWPTTLPIIPDGDHTTLEDAMSAVDAVYAAELEAAKGE